jgi:urease beta subunit
VIPGEYFLQDDDIVANAGRVALELTVANTGDRPIQVGSHFHFFEANRALRFDRARAFGQRLNIPAGTAVRFEPGDEKRVTLVPLAGRRAVFGLNALTEGGSREQALGRLATWQQSCACGSRGDSTPISTVPRPGIASASRTPGC